MYYNLNNTINMRSKRDAYQRNISCILVVLLYLAIYCTTSTFVKNLHLKNPTSKNPTIIHDIKVRSKKDHPPYYMQKKTWNILQDIWKKYKHPNKSTNSIYQGILTPMDIYKHASNSKTYIQNNAKIYSEAEINDIDNEKKKALKFEKGYKKLQAGNMKENNNNRTQPFMINSSSVSYSGLANEPDKLMPSLSLKQNFILSFMANNTLDLSRFIPQLYTEIHFQNSVPPRDNNLTMNTSASEAGKYKKLDKDQKLRKDFKDEATAISDVIGTTRIHTDNKTTSEEARGKNAQCFDAPLNHGPCNHLIKLYAWSFRDDLMDCFEFAYSGCGSSRNVFWSKKDCIEYCLGIPWKEYQNEKEINNNFDEEDYDDDDNVYPEYMLEEATYNDPKKDYMSTESVTKVGNEELKNAIPTNASYMDKDTRGKLISHSNDYLNPFDVMPVSDRQNFVYTRDNYKKMRIP